MDIIINYIQSDSRRSVALSRLGSLPPVPISSFPSFVPPPLIVADDCCWDGSATGGGAGEGVKLPICPASLVDAPSSSNAVAVSGWTTITAGATTGDGDWAGGGAFVPFPSFSIPSPARSAKKEVNF
jgi:hypothetical protein